MMEWAIQEAETLALPCFDLVPASRGDQPVAYWGGVRSDLPTKHLRGALQSTEHLLSIDFTVWDALGLKGRGPFALVREELRDDGGERAITLPVRSASVSGVTFAGAVPLKAVPSISLPPLDAVILYGGPAVDAWLKGRGLRRWEYAELTDGETKGYRSYFFERCPLTSSSPPFARAGGWHIP